MTDPSHIQKELIKLANGERLLRLSELESGLAIEKKIDAKQPLLRQQAQLLEAFAAALARTELTAS